LTSSAEPKYSLAINVASTVAMRPRTGKAGSAGRRKPMSEQATSEQSSATLEVPLADGTAAATASGEAPTPEQRDVGRPSGLATAVLSTPTHPERHSFPVRGVDVLPTSDFNQGRFGRMFRSAPVFLPDEKELVRLAQKMIQEPEPGKPLGEKDKDENPSIPAGYTYLGQFIGHDLTFDPASSLQRQNDPDALFDFRTPRFDLDSLYGRGPADQPYLYRHESPPERSEGDEDLDLSQVAFLLGDDVDEDERFKGPDLPRNRPRQTADGKSILFGRALIGDPRNDENLVVSQLHRTFLQFHNQMVEFVADTNSLRDEEDVLKEAQRQVRWHYQWVVVHDFLVKVVGKEVVDDILQRQSYTVNGKGGPKRIEVVRPRLRFYHPGRRPFIPVEFSVAAYRFGHSMVRPSYFFNDAVRETQPRRTPVFGPPPTATNELQNLNGFRRLPPGWGFQWKYFFDRLTDEPDLPQPSYRIDTELVNPLGNLPREVASNPSSLAERNLLRGRQLQLPSGQAVARAMGIPALRPEDLDLKGFSDSLKNNTPLWYYVLREAKAERQGTQLGSIGGRIVAEVLIGLLAADPLSYLNAAPGWTPEPELLRAPGPRRRKLFEMPELIRFALGEP
jgi:Animal haem peroxidase